MRILFVKGLKPIKPKSYVQPDDFEGQGLLLNFDVVDDSLPCQPTATATTRHLAALHLSVYADFNLSALPSAGLRAELKSIIAKHVVKLEKLNEEAVKKAGEPTPPR